MKLFFKISIFILFFIASSCKNDNETIKRLEKAEELMSTRPDSSLIIISEINQKDILRKKTYAYYGLLLTQALDKNYATPDSDSLIKYSVDYYSNTEDDKHKMLAYFYISRTIRNSDKRESINYLLKAEEIALKLQDHNLLGLIYYDLGLMNDEQFCIRSAEDCYKKSAVHFNLANNKQNEFYSHNNLIWFYIQDKKLDAAFKEINELQKISTSLNDSTLSLLANNVTAFYYLSIGNFNKAKEIAIKEIDKQFDKAESFPEILSTLGQTYHNNNQLDSALIVYKRIFAINQKCKDTVKMAGTAFLLSQLFKSKRDYKEALFYSEMQRDLLSQIRESINKNSTIETEKHFKNERIKAIKQELRIANRNIWLILTSSLLFVSLCLLLFSIVISKKNKRLMQVEIEQQKTEIQIQKMETKMLEAKQILLSKLQLMKSINDINNIWEGDKSKFDAKVQKLLDEYALTEESWEEVSKIVNQINDGLYDRLRIKHPNLSIDDIRLACMIIVGLEVSKISPILGINNDSVFKKRKRLKKKLELTAEEDLKKYLISIA